MPLRFVILHHTGYGEPHYDLMFETQPGSKLTTFRIPAWPIKEPTPVEKLPDHRSVYLEFEGPLSGDRGEVRRIIDGTIIIDKSLLDLGEHGRFKLIEGLTAWQIEPA